MADTELLTTPGHEPAAPAGRPFPWALIRTLLFFVLALVAWYWLYNHLLPFVEWYTYKVLQYPHVAGEHIVEKVCKTCGDTSIPEASISAAVRQGRAVGFLLFQVPHTFMLLALVVFLMGIVRSFFTPERTRRFLANKHPFWGTLIAALLGVVTPFCSCSAVPLFIGFVTAGVPLGATFAFLTAAPMVNEVAAAFLLALVGWKITALYVGTGLIIALITGWMIERMRMQRYVEEWVYAVNAGMGDDAGAPQNFNDRIRAGFIAMKDIVGRVWPYVLGGIIVGAFIHAYISRDAMIAVLGRAHWWSVPLAVLIGVPIYSNAAGIIPIVQALLAKGVGMGTALALMMAVVGLSLPEFIILRRVLKMRLLLTFAGVVAVGILIVGVLFNWLL